MVQISVTTRRVLPASGVYKPEAAHQLTMLRTAPTAKDYHATSVGGAVVERLAL